MAVFQYMKTCICCKVEKELYLFGVNKAKKDGYSIYCRECIKEKSKKYKLNNPEKVKHRLKIWREDNKTHRSIYRKQYYKNNLNQEKISSKKYRAKNKDQLSKKEKEYRTQNREHYLKKRKEYFQKNKHKHAKYVAGRRKDPTYRMVSNLRRRLRDALKGNNKSSTTIELLGCSIEELWVHLEKQFTIGMTKENHGRYGWHVDHIIPCDSFDLSDPEQQRKCFHYTNLQPLWAKDNIAKSNKICKQ